MVKEIRCSSFQEWGEVLKGTLLFNIKLSTLARKLVLALLNNVFVLKIVKIKKKRLENALIMFIITQKTAWVPIREINQGVGDFVKMDRP